MVAALPLYSTVVYFITVILFLYSLLSLSWSNALISGVSVEGQPTSAFFRLGLMTGYGYVEQGGKKVLSMESYGWCRYGQFALFQDEPRYCSTLTAFQVFAFLTTLVSFICFTISIFLLAGAFKTDRKNTIVIANTFLQLLQCFGAVISFTLWIFLHLWFNRDLNAYFPGVQLSLGSAFYAMVSAASITIVVCVASPFVWSIEAPMLRKEFPQSEDETLDEDLRQVIRSVY